MRCEERDQDLLLLTHGELSSLQRLRTRAHLLRCPRCRERQARFATVSAAMRSALSPSPAPHWPAGPLAQEPLRPAVSPTVGIAGWLRMAVLISLLTVLALLLAHVVQTLAHPQPAGSSSNVIDQGCTPGLPSDRCR